jgi:hypothetical protein
MVSIIDHKILVKPMAIVPSVHIHRTTRTGLLGLDSQVKTEKKGQPEQRRADQNRETWKGIAGKAKLDRESWIGRTEQADQDRQNKTTYTGLPRQSCLHMTARIRPEQDGKDKTVRKDRQKLTNRKGEAKLDKQNKIGRIGLTG